MDQTRLNWILIASAGVSALATIVIARSTILFHRWTRSLRNPMPQFVSGTIRGRELADSEGKRRHYSVNLVVANPGDVPIFIQGMRFETHRWRWFGAAEGIGRSDADKFWTLVSPERAADPIAVIGAREARFLQATTTRDEDALLTGTFSITIAVQSQPDVHYTRLGFFEVVDVDKLRRKRALYPREWAVVSFIVGTLLMLISVALSAVLVRGLWRRLRVRLSSILRWLRRRICATKTRH